MDHRLKVKNPAGLERLCSTAKSEHMLSTEPISGIEILGAWFAGEAYENHRHDTYAIGITDSGLQSYDYRGATQTSSPGSVMVLHPDEMHNGRAGSTEGFGYRMLYVDPALISDALRCVIGRPCPLPFARESVCDNYHLFSAVQLTSQVHC
ncbi:MAG: putative transcriptional regulator, AraC family protein [Osedax symbiont Rs2]|nr:MAG: putative transcriptional regulator, AraC family protein [Osedax symbiont Rs2]